MVIQNVQEAIISFVWINTTNPSITHYKQVLRHEHLQHCNSFIIFRYHLKDVIVGKIYFLLVRIKIRHMEIAIIRRETTGSGPNVFNENETIAKYEIMDGSPVRGESIPIRVFLAGYDLTPTMRDINKKFSVRYYLNLVLVDEEELCLVPAPVLIPEVLDPPPDRFALQPLAWPGLLSDGFEGPPPLLLLLAAVPV